MHITHDRSFRLQAALATVAIDLDELELVYTLCLFIRTQLLLTYDELPILDIASNLFCSLQRLRPNGLELSCVVTFYRGHEMNFVNC